MSYWFSFLFPWLVALWILGWLAAGRIRKDKVEDKVRWRGFVALAVAAAGIVLLPVRGFALGRWPAGIGLVPSIPLLGLLAGAVWKSFFQVELFRRGELRTAWIFEAVFGTALYPMALGLGDFDPYSWGWGFSALFPIVCVTTIVLIWNKNRFGLVLGLAIAAFDLRTLESPNFWDYLVDPVYWLLSVCVLVAAGLKRIRRREVHSQPTSHGQNPKSEIRNPKQIPMNQRSSPGVRPSSGAASCVSSNALEILSLAARSPVSAPEDGRTPLNPYPRSGESETPSCSPL